MFRKGQEEVCKKCEHCREGVTKSTKYGRRFVEKCFYNSRKGKALYNLDNCPKEKDS